MYIFVLTDNNKLRVSRKNHLHDHPRKRFFFSEKNQSADKNKILIVLIVQFLYGRDWQEPWNVNTRLPQPPSTNRTQILQFYKERLSITK